MIDRHKQSRAGNAVNSDGSPDRSDVVADAAIDNPVDRFAPDFARPYLRLMRLDRPVGFWLLFWPCAWSLTLAELVHGGDWLNSGFVARLLLFFAGAVVMRGAGCVWNDISDRHIDARVARTRSRPIPSGQVSVKNAVLFMLALCLAGLLVLLQFNRFTILLGLSSLLVVAVYPFMKRLTNWPQLVLGLAFGWGALMGWASVFASLDLPALLLYAGTICWIIGYDTIYAHQDREDDALIGMRSTALHFGDQTKKWLALFYGGTLLLLLAAVLTGAFEVLSAWRLLVILSGMAGGAVLLVWQIGTLDINDARNCLDRFRQAHIFGVIVFVTLLLAWAL